MGSVESSEQLQEDCLQPACAKQKKKAAEVSQYSSSVAFLFDLNVL